EVDLPISSGQVFSGWGVYSQAKPGGYSADVTMIPISVNGVFFTPATAILYGLMASSASLDSRVTALENGQVTNQNTDVIFPSYFYAVDGRPQRFYGANMVSGNRPWRNGADIVLSSHGYEGKPVLLKDAVPDAMIMPSEINGPTLNINARADGAGNVFRKKSTFTKLAASQTGSVKVATIMDSLGERCVPWLYFALNATGATYVGAGSRTTRGMSDDGGYVLPNTPSAGIPFDGRGGWTTFDYLGKTQKTNFSQPFLRDATSTDFAAYPQYCYDKAWSGQSYAENPSLSAYHIFDVTAWMAAAGVSTSDKLVVIIQLGYNDLYYSYTPQQTVDAQEFMIAKFREKIANARFVISHQAFGWSGVSAPQSWQEFAKWITQKLRKFDNRISEKILVAPAWAQLSYKYGMNETITATSDTGVQTVSLPDDVHPGELGGAQWGDALVAPVLAAWNL
ncbi:SGNH/GDSL hydrolase family protein, partial [Klebsiella pneumoniae]